MRRESNRYRGGKHQPFNATPRLNRTDSKTHLDVHALEIGNLFGEPAGVVDRARRHLILGDNTVGDGDPVIVFTERGCLVDDTRTRRCLDVAITYDTVGPVFKLPVEAKQSAGMLSEAGGSPDPN